MYFTMYGFITRSALPHPVRYGMRVDTSVTTLAFPYSTRARYRLHFVLHACGTDKYYSPRISQRLTCFPPRSRGGCPGALRPGAVRSPRVIARDFTFSPGSSAPAPRWSRCSYREQCQALAWLQDPRILASCSCTILSSSPSEWPPSPCSPASRSIRPWEAPPPPPPPPCGATQRLRLPPRGPASTTCP